TSACSTAPTGSCRWSPRSSTRRCPRRIDRRARGGRQRITAWAERPAYNGHRPACRAEGAPMTLLLTQSDVADLLELPRAMEATRQALREQAAEAVVAVPPRHINVARGAFRIVSGALLESQRVGVRLGPALGFTDATGGDRA